MRTAGQVLRANTKTSGKTLIAEISNAQLALPEGEEFKAENPFEGRAVSFSNFSRAKILN
ncbi:hypothetical protein [Kamptonema sp. UHCC 0994]|uniref:hypothetical protein n=1 Tax=Kamptonema sp. UHCC 0994 TaxID=3031329 RepID=UPI0023BAB731|nr:hypothetical protein [Kamptonema sp. UHCC 0994]MDF0556067.1 hypothetical protein [Kamptonema sp. UHCC 0994]